jgi:alkylation response protein AidB-like acyl-CoA dehydrogenase
VNPTTSIPQASSTSWASTVNPTCTLNYGENGGATGHLVGEPNHGLEYVFIMMNAARFSMGRSGFGDR